MPTFLLTWNPAKSNFTKLPAFARRLRKGKTVTFNWSCGGRKMLPAGSRVFLLRQGSQGHRGIIGSGRSVTEPYEEEHYDPVRAAEGQTGRCIDIEWDALLVPPQDTILPRDELFRPPLDRVNWNSQSSGILIEDEAARELERAWAQVIGTSGVTGSQRDHGGRDGEDPLQLIRARRNQGPFREALRTRYGDRCMVSGCTIVELLEAAHIEPYRKRRDNRVGNGLLLRSDLHTLFDLNLLGIHPETLVVQVKRSARREGYELLHGRRLLCDDQRPSTEELAERWKTFNGRD